MILLLLCSWHPIKGIVLNDFTLDGTSYPTATMSLISSDYLHLLLFSMLECLVRSVYIPKQFVHHVLARSLPCATYPLFHFDKLYGCDCAVNYCNIQNTSQESSNGTVSKAHRSILLLCCVSLSCFS